MSPSHEIWPVMELFYWHDYNNPLFAFQNLESSWNHVSFIAIDPHTNCCNPSLGLMTKGGACKSAGQEGSPGGTSYTPGSVRKCERMNPHTPKWAPTLGSWNLDGLLNLQGVITRVKTHWKKSLYHWKAIKTQMSKMGLQDPFGH
jgi:hypothetical protein